VVDLPGRPNLEGTFIINGLPTFKRRGVRQVYWYQLVFSDSQGDQKVYNFYSESGGTAGDPDRQRRLRADGGATLARSRASPPRWSSR